MAIDDGRGLCVGLDKLRFEQKVVMIAHDAWAIQLDEEVNASLGRWSQRCDVTQANNLVDAAPADVGEHGAKGDVVAVNVGEQCDPHRVLCSRNRLSGGIWETLSNSATFLKRNQKSA